MNVTNKNVVFFIRLNLLVKCVAKSICSECRKIKSKYSLMYSVKCGSSGGGKKYDIFLMKETEKKCIPDCWCLISPQIDTVENR